MGLDFISFKIKFSVLHLINIIMIPSTYVNLVISFFVARLKELQYFKRFKTNVYTSHKKSPTHFTLTNHLNHIVKEGITCSTKKKK